MKVLLTIVVLATAVVAVILFGSRKEPEVAADRIVHPEVGDLVAGVLAVGRVEPRTRVEVKSKANGIVERFLVEVNDPVKKGQIIAELDRELLDARVVEADGKLQQALAARDLARSELDRIAIERDDPEIHYAEQSWKRIGQLYEDAVVSIDERDAAKERDDKARYQLRILDAREKAARATLASAEGRVKEVQAVADLARQELQEATIVSPIDGVVLYRYLEEGDSVSSIRVAGGNATVLMTLGDLSELYVDGEVDEVDVGRILSRQQLREGLAARVTVQSYKDREFAGRVIRVTPLGLEDSNGIVTFEVRIALENPEHLLLANMTANSRIVLEERNDVLLLSQGALLREGDERFVQVFDPATGIASRRPVEIGLSDGTQVEIKSGLRAEDKVVLP